MLINKVKKPVGVLKVIMGAGIFFSLVFVAQARQPSAIELSYDKDKSLLHIVIKHTSNNLREHHIRKVTVTKNKETAVPYYFPTQTSATELILDVPLIAIPNDTIRVEAVCSEAGRGEQELVIPGE